MFLQGSVRNEMRRRRDKITHELKWVPELQPAETHLGRIGLEFDELVEAGLEIQLIPEREHRAYKRVFDGG
jgi:hypothetical protein